MTTAGISGGGGVRRLRVLTAVLTLYALVLQAFLGGIVATAAAASPALPFDVHCLDATDGAPSAGRSGPHAPADHQACCCTAVQAAAGTPPLPAAASPVRPPRPVVRLVWRMDGVAAARAPPFTLASARAPPAV